MSKCLWKPSKERIQNANFQKYFSFLKKTYQLDFKDYDQLYAWSVENIETFWKSLWRFFNIQASAPIRVMGEPKMPGTEWFKGTTFNFAQNLLRYRDDRLAIISVGEKKKTVRLSYKDLYKKVAQCASALKKAGVAKGDRVAAFVPNIAETVVAMLAANSMGAIFSSCSPDFGIQGVLDRFGQIQPKVLFTADGYTYHGKPFDSLERVSRILEALPSIERVVVIPYLNARPDISGWTKGALWEDFVDPGATDISFKDLPFDHPLYIMYSSGTTGIPKCIVHGQGGTLLQHLKELALHTDLKRGDRICYLTTCGWMMWNWLVSSLAVGATVVLSEGSLAYPSAAVKWRMAEEEKITIFGLSPKALSVYEKAGIEPGKIADLTHLKTILSTGSPLSPKNFEWVYAHVKKDLQLSSICGGTDIISCFMLGNPLLPVHAGEIQCRGLGMKVNAFDEQGRAVIGQKGELVCTAPFPSMPIYFWNDPGNKKYKEAYFERYPDVWYHGDYIEITPKGGVIVYGRSDATLNPGGVRLGTAEIYRQLEGIHEIRDSIVVGQRWEGDIRILLFVMLKTPGGLTPALIQEIKTRIKKGASPRHVPAKILEVKDIPYTISGKKVEMAVSNVIHGEPVKNKDALANPKALEQFKDRRELKS